MGWLWIYFLCSVWELWVQQEFRECLDSHWSSFLLSSRLRHIHQWAHHDFNSVFGEADLAHNRSWQFCVLCNGQGHLLSVSPSSCIHRRVCCLLEISSLLRAYWCIHYLHGCACVRLRCGLIFTILVGVPLQNIDKTFIFPSKKTQKWKTFFISS